MAKFERSPQQIVRVQCKVTEPLAVASGYGEQDAREPPTGRRRSGGNMFLGLRTAIYHVDDIEKAKAWYSEVLGTKPYFDQPFYVGFNVAGYELGLQPGAGNTADNAD